MHRSLLGRVYLPLVLALATLGGLLGRTQQHLERMTQRLAAAQGLRDRLDQALQSLEDRHVRTLRRTREALLEALPRSTQAMLQQTGAGYVRDVDRQCREARALLSKMAHAAGDVELADDLGRLQRHFDRLAAEAQRVATVFDALLAASVADDAVALHTAQRHLLQADRSMSTLLGIGADMVRTVAAADAYRTTAAAAAAAVPWWGFITLGAALVACLAYSWWPLQQLCRLLLQLHDGRGAGDAEGPQAAFAGGNLEAPAEGKSAGYAVGHAAGHARCVGVPPARRYDAAAARRPLSREERSLRHCLDSLDQEIETARTAEGNAVRTLARTAQLLRRAEHDLALLRFYNDNLVNSLRSAIVVTDASGTITAINRVARDLLHLDDTALGTPMADTQLYGATAAQHQALPTALQEAAARCEALEFRAIPYDLTAAQPTLLDLTVAPYRDESGAARGLLYVADDVTDAVQTKHQLLQAERLAAVGRLSAQVAHEIRNPLSAIGLNAELLEEEFSEHLSGEGASEAREMLVAIGKEIERLTEVTEAYLQLARLPRPQMRRVDINLLVADLFVMLATEMRSHGIEVGLDLGTPAPQARLDPGQLRQALINIVRNSREAMPHGGQLQVRTRRSATQVVIDIGDTGEGIAPEVLPRIFEPFFSTKPYGTGLGLSLTQQIVSEHGGKLVLQPATAGNEATAVGTCVSLLFPCEPEALAARPL